MFFADRQDCLFSFSQLHLDRTLHPWICLTLFFSIPAANMPVSLPRSPSGGLVWPLPISPFLWKRLSTFSLAAWLHLYRCVFPLSSPSLSLSRCSSAISRLCFLYIPPPMSLALCLLCHVCLSLFRRPPSQLTLDIQSFFSPCVPLPSPPWPRVTQEARGTPLKKSQGWASTCASPPGLQIGTWCWDLAVLPLGAGQDAARL